MTFRIVFLALFVCFIAPVVGLNTDSIAGEQDAFTPFLAEPTGDRVNVRAGQSANFERLCQLNKGDQVVVVGKEFSWYKIELPSSAISYVNKDYVQFLGQNAGGITADYVNVRSGAGIHHTVLGQLTRGQQVYIQEELDKWYRIEPVQGSYGWVLDKYLTFKSEDLGDYQFTLPPKPYVIEEDLSESDWVMVLPSEDQTEEQVIEEVQEEPVTYPVIEAIEEKNPGVISVVGYVEAYENTGTDGIYYKIVEDGQPACYVQGVNHMLGRFVNLKVKVEGTVNQKLLSRYDHPVISVLKIRLML